MVQAIRTDEIEVHVEGGISSVEWTQVTVAHQADDTELAAVADHLHAEMMGNAEFVAGGLGGFEDIAAGRVDRVSRHRA